MPLSFSPRRTLLPIILAITPISGALAQSRIGTLHCELSGGVGLILVENQALDCIFQDDAGSPPEHYSGRLTNIGANIGISGPGELVWAVAAATAEPGPGALAGDYVGPQGSLALGAGAGGGILGGGSRHSFSLQPISFQLGTGLNVSAGVGDLHLDYVPDIPPPGPR